ncbi:MAG: stage II sporulation protein M [Methanospirillum sp.]|nr:stage II sporulation protein M [Methanospirillum sp.]
MIRFPPLFRDTVLICTVLLMLSSAVGYGTLTLLPEVYSITQIGEDEIVLPSDDIPQAEYILKLFVSNLEIVTVAFLGGFLLGTGPIIILIINGFMFGAIFKLLTENGLVFLLSLVPHMILEIPAFIIACALGLLAGEISWNYLLKKERPDIKIRDLVILFLVYPVLLLACAAIIEGLVSVQLLGTL